MSEKKSVRLNKLAKEFNVSLDRILSFLGNKGVEGIKPSSKISHDLYMDLLGEFQPDLKAKIAADIASKAREAEREEQRIIEEQSRIKKAEEKKKSEKIVKEKKAKEQQEVKNDVKVLGKIDLELNKKKKDILEEKIAEKQTNESQTSSDEDMGIIKAEAEKLSGPKITGKKIDLDKLDTKKKSVTSSSVDAKEQKKKRKRITNKVNPKKFVKSKVKTKKADVEISPEEAQKRIRETLAKLQGSGKKKSVKNRREKRQAHKEIADQELQERIESKIVKIAEFATANELSTMMEVPVNEIISSLMSLGFMVTMNQRLDAETLQIIVEDFGFEVEFVGADVQESIEIEDVDKDEDLLERSPIVTIMGHVDHGKTSLLDYIREANVIAGEAGGITQHIGAYEVTLPNGKRISFLDTPGHEAFTAMRARGAKVTDIVVIVIAADDRVMPQTKEAISHAQAADVPIIFAINKIDKETSDPDKIKGELAEMNLLVEDWGGKIQSQDISAKTGLGVAEILEKILLESEMLELRANPNRPAVGSVIEASLDKGKGYVTTILVQKGTLNVGDYVLAGSYSGKVKALLNERGNPIKEAGPSTPATLLGLNGAPTAGDVFNVMESEQEAKKVATKRMQLQREQSVRTQKHITLDEIGRRIALGDFQELNIIVKGDVDGSIEALSDSLEKLSTDSIKVNIIQKAVGQISESDIMLASASDAIVIGFQVRPSLKARKLAETEQIDVRLYSVIYKAIEEIKLAMEGMLSPDFEEQIVCNIEIRETFKISKVGTIAGCMVLDGKLNRKTGVRIIRDGVVVYTGKLSSLKRFKEDVQEVQKGYECGLSIENYNDIKIGDIIEGYEEVEVKRTL
ncbi:MAG: translation initiation factor IF-2 [Flavobacteriales bacterium]|nr:translation initiation factor IF-2 [Flavobacteriales bacterium]|tara:strand:+ start:2948 stop:5518 length:2571 start_codon:yes stop_codon:yes gene_type:complete